MKQKIHSLEKDAKIDWFQISFDFIKVNISEEGLYKIDKESPLLYELLAIINPKINIFQLESKKGGFNGYIENIELSPGIHLLYGGLGHKQGNITLLLTNMGCKTFDSLNSDWHDLIIFFNKNKPSLVNRIDFKIEDYDGAFDNLSTFVNKVKNQQVNQPKYFKKIITNSSYVFSGDTTKLFEEYIYLKSTNTELQVTNLNSVDLRFTKSKAKEILENILNEFDDKSKINNYLSNLLIHWISFK